VGIHLGYISSFFISFLSSLNVDINSDFIEKASFLLTLGLFILLKLFKKNILKKLKTKLESNQLKILLILWLCFALIYALSYIFIAISTRKAIKMTLFLQSLFFPSLFSSILFYLILILILMLIKEETNELKSE
jgi:hypothetical protein